MAGETLKTLGIVLDIRPWSRTSHIVTWLTPDRGPVTTLVKGAVRAKSAFLGQYDFFYTCELVYYVRARGDLHAIREASPVDTREYLRGNFRAAAIASYASYLIREHCPHNPEADEWFRFFSGFLDGLRSVSDFGMEIIGLEMRFLELAGLSPDFTGADFSVDAIPFAIDLGRAGKGAKTVQLSSSAARFLSSGSIYEAENVDSADISSAMRFLGLFLRYHVDMPPDIRRSSLELAMSVAR